jgi:probable HAF family extracellular repeat protein
MRSKLLALFLGCTALVAVTACDDALGPVDGPASQNDYALRPSFAVTQSISVADLWTLGGTGIHVAHGVNNLGHVVGTSTTSQGAMHAFFWSAARGMVDLGTTGGGYSYARGINDADMVVGLSEDGTGHTEAFWWTLGRGMRGLGRFGGVESSAYAVNNLGQVVGQYTPAAFDPAKPAAYRGVQSFLWDFGRGFQELSTLGSKLAGFAYGLNDRGQVVGVSAQGDAPTDPFLAFVWTPTGGSRSMGTLGPEYTEYDAFGISPFGHAVGSAFDATDGTWHPFIWTEAQGLTDLKSLGFPAEASGLALDINAFDQIAVLLLEPDGTRTPAVWVPGVGLVTLPTLGGQDGEIWTINDLGFIAGWSQTASGEMRPAVWQLAFSAQDHVQDVIAAIKDLIATNTDKKIEQDLTKALDRTQRAVDRLNEDPPNADKALEELARAAKELTDAIDHGIDPSAVSSLLEVMTQTARDLAVAAIDAAEARGGNPGNIRDAQSALAQGDSRRAAHDYEEAIKQYREALQDAEKA